MVLVRSRELFSVWSNLLFMCETLFYQGSYYRAAMIPVAAVFQRISDLSKNRWQPPCHRSERKGGCRVILLGQVFGQFAGEENPIGLVFTGNPVQEVFKPRN